MVPFLAFHKFSFLVHHKYHTQWLLRRRYSVGGKWHWLVSSSAKRTHRSSLKSGGFIQTKWASHVSEFVASLPEEFRETKISFDLTDENSIKALGVHWTPSTDIIGFYFVWSARLAGSDNNYWQNHIPWAIWLLGTIWDEVSGRITRLTLAEDIANRLLPQIKWLQSNRCHCLDSSFDGPIPLSFWPVCKITLRAGQHLSPVVCPLFKH